MGARVPAWASRLDSSPFSCNPNDLMSILLEIAFTINVKNTVPQVRNITWLVMYVFACACARVCLCVRVCVTQVNG